MYAFLQVLKFSVMLNLFLRGKMISAYLQNHPNMALIHIKYL